MDEKVIAWNVTVAHNVFCQTFQYDMEDEIFSVWLILIPVQCTR